MGQSARLSKEGWVCVGVIAEARGLQGELRVRSFTVEPADIAAYGPVWDEAARRSFTLKVVGSAKGRIIVRIAGIDDRTAAEALKGTTLFVRRDALPEPGDEEYYHVDLLGLDAILAADNGSEARVLGKVRAVHDHGAGTVIEIEGKTTGVVVVPFTRAAVPSIDLTRRRLVVAPLPGLLPSSESDGEADDDGHQEGLEEAHEEDQR